MVSWQILAICRLARLLDHLLVDCLDLCNLHCCTGRCCRLHMACLQKMNLWDYCHTYISVVFRYLRIFVLVFLFILNQNFSWQMKKHVLTDFQSFILRTHLLCKIRMHDNFMNINKFEWRNNFLSMLIDRLKARFST